MGKNAERGSEGEAKRFLGQVMYLAGARRRKIGQREGRITILKLGSRSGGCRSGSFPSLKSFNIILNHVLLF